MTAAGAPPLRDLFGPGGALAAALEGYELREPQLEMARQVEEALRRGVALLVEAGTGTGKTLAYLVPAARSGLKVVVSTATKNLQEQLLEKDVPLLRRLGIDAKVAFLKGRQNYLCLLRWEQHQRQPTFFSRDEAAYEGALLRFVERTRTGDRAELTELPEAAEIFGRLTSTAETCTGSKCAHYERCFVYQMRRQAADADVVVVNHHLFFADLALRSSSAGDAGAAVLPRYDAVIFDEAHALEEVATEHFGAALSSRRVAELAKDAAALLAGQPELLAARDLALRLGLSGADFFESALALRPAPAARAPADRAARTAGRGDAAAARPPERSESERWTLVAGALAPVARERAALREQLRSLAAALSGPAAGADEQLSLLARRCEALLADLALFDEGGTEPGADPTAPADGAPGGDLVRWAEVRGGQLVLHASPLDVGRLLQDRLYDQIGPVVFTSATLAVGGSLGFFARSAGLADADGPLYPTVEAVLPSPFDYQRNAALYLPRALPEPQHQDFAAAVAAEIVGLSPLTGGRAFALFTSLRNMRAAHALAGGALRGSGLQVLLQGEAPKGELLRRFRDRPSVLFASQSFWEGVDVPGEALQLVVIDKLPFASPQEPLTAARIQRLRAAGEDAFSDWQVPQAALSLKQGFGRLIRTARDRGVVAVLDPRLSTRGYGRTFLATLPRCRVLRSQAEVASFCEGWSAG